MKRSTNATLPSAPRPEVSLSEWLLILDVGATPQIFPLPARGTVLVGRDDDCAIFVDATTISRRHARIVLGDHGPIVDDLGSRNGTRVDGVALSKGVARELSPSSRILFGNIEARVRRVSHLGVRAANAQQETDPDGTSPFELEWPDGPIVADASMIDLYARVACFAESTLSVLVLGQTGVGKELVAEAVHRFSPRSSAPFVALDCTGLPESLVEAELFGYERGAFTGAIAQKTGLIESAHGGTLFLDEVGELSAAMQTKLLRALEKGEVRRLGSVQSRRVDVRCVSATNRDLSRMVDEGSFRADLYFRLSGFVVRVPPLRERPADVLALAAHFAARAAERTRRPTPRLAPDAVEALQAHPWPGNVRELRAVMERALALRQSEEIRAQDLIDGEERPLAVPMVDDGSSPSLGAQMQRRLAAEERHHIVEALRRTNGHQAEAARLLGISRRALINRLDLLRIDRPRKRRQ